MKKTLTKATAVKNFKFSFVGDSMDKPAVREAWNNYTDMLQKSGQITPKQYDQWDNPF